MEKYLWCLAGDLQAPARAPPPPDSLMSLVKVVDEEEEALPEEALSMGTGGLSSENQALDLAMRFMARESQRNRAFTYSLPPVEPPAAKRPRPSGVIEVPDTRELHLPVTAGWLLLVTYFAPLTAVVQQVHEQKVVGRRLEGVTLVAEQVAPLDMQGRVLV